MGTGASCFLVEEEEVYYTPMEFAVNKYEAGDVVMVRFEAVWPLGLPCDWPGIINSVQRLSPEAFEYRVYLCQIGSITVKCEYHLRSSLPSLIERFYQSARCTNGPYLAALQEQRVLREFSTKRLKPRWLVPMFSADHADDLEEALFFNKCALKVASILMSMLIGKLLYALKRFQTG